MSRSCCVLVTVVAVALFPAAAASATLTFNDPAVLSKSLPEDHQMQGGERLKAKLRKGTYAVVARAIDSVGNRERPVRGSRGARRNHNRFLFRVR